MTNEVLDSCKSDMEKTIAAFRKELSHVRTGRASTALLEGIMVEYYGAKTPNHTCAVYEDFRVMLAKEKAIDAVLIATPDHLHAYVSIIAMKAGKHVYCEKPLTHNISEARLVARVAKETGVATQMGNHGRSSEGHRQTVEWIKDGAIGARQDARLAGRLQHAFTGLGADRGAVHCWSGWREGFRPVVYGAPARV